MGNSFKKKQILKKTQRKILSYYLFQKKLKKYLINDNIEDRHTIKKGKIIFMNDIKNWKNLIRYDSLSQCLDSINIQNTELDDEQKQNIMKYIEDNEIQTMYYNYNYDIFNKVEKYNAINRKIFSKDDLEILLDEKTSEYFNKNSMISTEYIFKKQMFIIIIEKNQVIKLLIFSLYPYNEGLSDKLINISFIFYNKNEFKKCRDLFKKNSSKEIIDYLILNIKIFEFPKQYILDEKGVEAQLCVFYEEEYINIRNKK